MNPDEVELPRAVVLRLITRIEAGPDIERPAGNVKFDADVAAGAAARHGIEDGSRLEIQQQVFDEDAAAVAGIPRIAIWTTICPVKQTRESWVRARVTRSLRENRDLRECR